MTQVAGLQDFRGAGPPGDTGTYQMPCTVLVFQFIFSGTTYCAAIRAGDRGWIEVAKGTVASTVINAALAASLDGYCFCVVPSTYTLTAPITSHAKNSITFGGGGAGTIFYVANTTTINAFELSSVTSWVIHDLTIDGNFVNNPQGGNDLFQNGVYCTDVIRTVFDHCWIKNCPYEGISLYLECEENKIIDSWFIENIQNNVYIYGPSTFATTVIGNHLIAIPATTHGNLFLNQTYDNIIEGNYVYGRAIIMDQATKNTVNGNIVYLSYVGGIDLYRSSYNVITNNTIIDFSNAAQYSYYGIYLYDDGAVLCQQNLVANNTIFDTRTGAALRAGYGIEVNAAEDNQVIGNRIRKCWYGIHGQSLSNTKAYVMVVNNYCAVSGVDGIFFVTSGAHLTISGNQCFENGGDGIKAHTIDALICVGNDCSYNSLNGFEFTNAHYWNLIDSNIAHKNVRNGIFYDSCLSGTCSGNVLVENDVGNTATYDGLQFTWSDDIIVDGNYIADNDRFGINIANAGCDRIRIGISNILKNNTSGPIQDLGTNTQLPTIRACFIKELGTAAWIVAAAAPMGIDIDAADEGALAKIKLPPDLQQVVRIKVWGIAQVAEADHMMLLVVAGAGGDNETWNAEAITPAAKIGDTVNFANLDVVQWTFTSADDADIGHLVAGDFLQWCCYYNAAAGVDCATDLLLAGEGLEIQYV